MAQQIKVTVTVPPPGNPAVATSTDIATVTFIHVILIHFSDHDFDSCEKEVHLKSTFIIHLTVITTRHYHITY